MSSAAETHRRPENDGKELAPGVLALTGVLLAPGVSPELTLRAGGCHEDAISEGYGDEQRRDAFKQLPLDTHDEKTPSRKCIGCITTRHAALRQDFFILLHSLLACFPSVAPFVQAGSHFRGISCPLARRPRSARDGLSISRGAGLVGRVGIEPTTNGLRVRCSTS